MGIFDAIFGPPPKYIRALQESQNKLDEHVDEYFRAYRQNKKSTKTDDVKEDKRP